MNVSRRTFLASAALFALVRPNLLLKEELSALAEEPVVDSFNRANLSFAQSNDVSFGGFFGTRYKQSLDRLTASPIDNVPFVLDDEDPLCLVLVCHPKSSHPTLSLPAICRNTC